MPLSTATLRFLASEFEVRSDSPEILDHLQGLAPRARQDQEIHTRHAWRIAVGPGVYRLIDETGAETAAVTLTAFLSILRNRIDQRAFAALPQHSIIHAAIGQHAGHGFLLVGGRGSGKTTLAIALLLAGIDVSGDDLVLLRDGQAIAYPRQFLVWESARSLTPGLPPYRGQPLLFGQSRELQVPIDPIDLDRDWIVRPVPISAVICLDDNFGGRSTMRRCGTLEAIQRVLPHCAPPPSGDPAWIGRLCAALDRAHTAVLTLGTLDSAVRWIRLALDRLSPLESLPDDCAPP